MTTETMTRILVLSAMTGVRSTTGLTTLAASRGGALHAVLSLVTAGEMVADKTSAVGNRTDPVPLAGRAALGALVGALIARHDEDDMILGGAVGAATAVVAAHLAYQARTRLAPRGVAGGLIEDALLVGIASRFSS